MFISKFSGVPRALIDASKPLRPASGTVCHGGGKTSTGGKYGAFGGVLSIAHGFPMASSHNPLASLTLYPCFIRALSVLNTETGSVPFPCHWHRCSSVVHWLQCNGNRVAQPYCYLPPFLAVILLQFRGVSVVLRLVIHWKPTDEGRRLSYLCHTYSPVHRLFPGEFSPLHRRFEVSLLGARIFQPSELNSGKHPRFIHASPGKHPKFIRCSTRTGYKPHPPLKVPASDSEPRRGACPEALRKRAKRALPGLARESRNDEAAMAIKFIPRLENWYLFSK